MQNPPGARVSLQHSLAAAGPAHLENLSQGGQAVQKEQLRCGQAACRARSGAGSQRRLCPQAGPWSKALLRPHWGEALRGGDRAAPSPARRRKRPPCTCWCPAGLTASPVASEDGRSWGRGAMSPGPGHGGLAAPEAGTRCRSDRARLRARPCWGTEGSQRPHPAQPSSFLRKTIKAEQWWLAGRGAPPQAESRLGTAAPVRR